MTITNVIAFPTFPSGAPWSETGLSGSYSTSTGDLGTLSADASFGAVPTGGVNPQGKPNQSTYMSATGSYAGLNGSGKITSGVADFSAVPYPILTDTVALG